MESHRQGEFYVNLMYHESVPGYAGRPHLDVYIAGRVTRSGRQGYRPWRVTHLSCKLDQIKMRDYMDSAGYLTYLGSLTSM